MGVMSMMFKPFRWMARSVLRLFGVKVWDKPETREDYLEFAEAYLRRMGFKEIRKGADAPPPAEEKEEPLPKVNFFAKKSFRTYAIVCRMTPELKAEAVQQAAGGRRVWQTRSALVLCDGSVSESAMGSAEKLKVEVLPGVSPERLTLQMLLTPSRVLALAAGSVLSGAVVYYVMGHYETVEPVGYAVLVLGCFVICWVIIAILRSQWRKLWDKEE